MRLSYYPGCSLEGTARDYDRAVRAICEAIDVELVEIDDWNCCGASSAHMTDHEIGMQLPIRNLLLAQSAGLDILVPCAACFQRLKAADKALQADPGYWGVSGYERAAELIHISTFLGEERILSALAEKAAVRLEGLRVGCYYGCLSLRNPRVTDAADWEQPRTLERLAAALGARAVRWSHPTECCSGSLAVTRPDIARRLVGEILDAARRAGAQALITDCPMCQANVESRAATTVEPLPVYYSVELAAAAIAGGYTRKQAAAHLVPATLLAEICESSVAAAKGGGG